MNLISLVPKLSMFFPLKPVLHTVRMEILHSALSKTR